MFLDASPHVRVHVFDNTTFAQARIMDHLKARHGPRRLEHHMGDPCETVPVRLSPVQKDNKPMITCDILFGSNPSCLEDNLDLAQNAPCGALLTSMATKKLRDPLVYFGVNTQWQRLKRKGCVRDITCFASDNKTNKANKFCMAVTTAKCQKLKRLRKDNNCETSAIAQLTKRIVLGRVCPSHEVRIPEPMRQQTSAQFASVKKPTKEATAKTG
ncbi:expressed unknown protein [Seminavis robusta]|uniref:Uncharacterized protein n=1 Tax=Seminavis robusta TaxID=568900 RepID=A0A9N8EG13_9STRA|nr:expressed unknown protein [Seminavis robusta]|eukprot:Sro938_g222260.1 n/a (214) ;mRNA; f:9538-10179